MHYTSDWTKTGHASRKAQKRAQVAPITNFAGIQPAPENRVERRKPCEACGTTTPKRTPCWLSQRWLCSACARRYDLLEERARVCGVKQPPYVAPGSTWHPESEQLEVEISDGMRWHRVSALMSMAEAS